VIPYFFLYFSFTGILVSILTFFQDRNARWFRLPVILLLLVFSIIMADYFLIWTRSSIHNPFRALTGILYFTLGPLLYIYQLRLKEIFLSRKKIILHFLPFILLSITVLPLIFGIAHFTRNSIFAYLFSVIPWLTIIHLGIYFLLIYRQRTDFYKVPKLNSFTRLLRLFFLGFTLAFASYYILVVLQLMRPDYDYAISAFMCLFISGIMAIGYLQPDLLSNNVSVYRTPPKGRKYAHSPLTDDSASEIAVRIISIITQTQLWRKNDIDLSALSQQAGYQRSYVSQAINQHFNKNFYELVNDFRIAEAKELLSAEANLTITEICYQVGFNNKVTFHSAFKTRTGKTPGEFRSENLAKNENR
jgi:AraC-like DNA-binding protein